MTNLEIGTTIFGLLFIVAIIWAVWVSSRTPVFKGEGQASAHVPMTDADNIAGRYSDKPVRKSSKEPNRYARWSLEMRDGSTKKRMGFLHDLITGEVKSYREIK